jgi:hypothetical protein
LFSDGIGEAKSFNGGDILPSLLFVIARNTLQSRYVHAGNKKQQEQQKRWKEVRAQKIQGPS